MPSSRMPKSMAEKKEVVQWIEKNGGVPTPAAVYFKNERGWKVSEAQVRYWWKQRTAIKAAQALRSRLSGAGAKPRLSEIEDILFDQVLFRRSAKEKVSRDWIRDAGQRLAASELGDADFVASDRWVNGFMRRCGLSLRRTANLTVLTDDVLTDRAVSFLSYLTSRIDGLSNDHTILMDETAVYFEDPRRQTVDQVGARHVVLKYTGFASMRVTAVLAVTATGRKLPTLVVWKGAKQDGKIERYGNVYVVNQPKAWVDSALLTRWLDLVFPPIFDTCTQGKALVWDSMRAHISKMVKARCTAKGVQMFVIPGGLTPYVQAGYIGIYKSFKDKLSPIIDSSKKSDAVLYTRGGNPKPPSVVTVANWVNVAWRDVPADVVERSVAAAGFSPRFGDWHVARHDLYGELFCSKWKELIGENADDVSDNGGALSEDCFDEYDLGQRRVCVGLELVYRSNLSTFW